jgi:hypothetical protein
LTALGAVQELLNGLRELDQKHFLGSGDWGDCQGALLQRESMLQALRQHCEMTPESLLGCLGEVEALGARTTEVAARVQRQRLEWIQSLQEMETHLKQLRAIEEKRPQEAQILNRLA